MNDNRFDESYFELTPQLEHRALMAYFKQATRDSERVVQPESVEGRELDGRQYIVLVSQGILAVYRIKNDGLLRRLKRYPKELIRIYDQGDDEDAQPG